MDLGFRVSGMDKNMHTTICPWVCRGVVRGMRGLSLGLEAEGMNKNMETTMLLGIRTGTATRINDFIPC